MFFKLIPENFLPAFSSYIFYGFIGILGIGLLIGIHELGHFLFAKLFNVRTPSFSIGFGPRVLSKQIGDTLFSLSAIPLGGYVEISGMAEVGQGEQKDAQNKGNDSFSTKPYYQKMLILLGGILFNLIFAYLSLILVFTLGVPKSDLLYPLGIATEKSVIHAVGKNSPAEKANLKVDDEIISITTASGERINSDNNGLLLKSKLRELPGETVSLHVKRPATSEEFDVQVTLDERDIIENGISKKIGLLGTVFEIDQVPSYSFTEAVTQGIRATNIYIAATMAAFKNMFVKRDIAGVGGPIMIINQTIKGAQKGFKIFLLFLAIISINLAILNLIPLPILDGGQIFFVTIEALLGREMPKLREYIHIGSWILMLALFVFLTLRDLGITSWFNIG